MDASSNCKRLPALDPARRFRVGVTSYVYPDDLLPNVERLVEGVDDIEVLLFETSEVSNLPSPDTIARMADLAQRNSSGYTVHLPLNAPLGDKDDEVRRRAVKSMREIVTLTRPLRPWAYILHLEGFPHAEPGAVPRWQARCEASLRELLATPGLDPGMVAVENLDYPFEHCDEPIERHGVSVCIDIGHLRRSGQDVSRHLARYLERARVVHLHGERDGKDHQSLAVEPPERLRAVLRRLDGFRGVVTLELFDFERVAQSIRRLNEELSFRSAADG